MWPGRDKAQIVGRLGVTGESERAHGCRAPIQLLFANRECVAVEGDASVEFHSALTFEGRLDRNWPDIRRIGGVVIDDIDELVDCGRLSRVAGAVLQFLSVIEEEATVVSAKGEAGDG